MLTDELLSRIILVSDESCRGLIFHIDEEERCKEDQTSNGQALAVTWETAPELNGTCLSMSDCMPAGWSDCMKTIKTGRCGLKRVAVSANGQLLWAVRCPKHLVRAARGET